MMTTLIGTGIVIGSLIGAVILWYLIGCVILWEKPFKHEEYHIETGPKIFMGFFITALLSLLIFIGHTVGNAYYTECEPEKVDRVYDYKLDLGKGSCNYVIFITDEYGNTNIIHPDSLEEFIIKDNL